MKEQLKISQCMIVKNEEKNIRRALSWGKEIMWEQIVVDTGSDDATVEIAREMGAKVFQYEWKDDFSAAKNFAIEKAKGDWICFLDADEYFSAGDVEKLRSILATVHRIKQKDQKPEIIRTKLVNLDDEGKITSDTLQERVFRNLPYIRYRKPIHEELTVLGKERRKILDCQEKLTILHTGYSRTAYQDTDKANRNITILKRELEKDEDDYNALGYLGDSLLAAGKVQEAMECFYKVSWQQPGENGLTPARYAASVQKLMKILCRNHDSENRKEMERLHLGLAAAMPDHPDGSYYMGCWMAEEGRLEEARGYLETALELLETYRGVVLSNMSGSLSQVYAYLAKICAKEDDAASCVRYAVLSLRLERTQEDLLTLLLVVLKRDPEEQTYPEGTIRVLEMLYQTDSPKDLVLMLRAAGGAQFLSLQKYLKEKAEKLL